MVEYSVLFNDGVTSVYVMEFSSNDYRKCMKYIDDNLWRLKVKERFIIERTN
jgi:hypothetical protein